MADDSVHKETALSLARDKFGHFLKSKSREKPVEGAASFITSLLNKNVTVSKNQVDDESKDDHTSKTDDETLVDIHVNNPLIKIVELLKDLKKQKAFSFSVKGSVGIVGVAVVLVGGGILGGNKIICNKGTQVKIGEVRVLSFSQPSTSPQPIRDRIRAIFGITVSPVSAPTKWVILIDSQQTAVRLLSKSQTYIESFAGHTVTAVGDFNACNQELTVSTSGLEDIATPKSI